MKAGEPPTRRDRYTESLLLWLANHLPRLHTFERRRDTLLRLAGMDIRGRCVIWGPLTIRPIGAACRITIGAGAFVNTEVRFAAPAERIVIGENVQAARSRLRPGRGRGYTTEPIFVEDEVWIGAGTTVLQGVRIGRGAVITAGAVVTEDVPAGTLAGGVPARVLRVIEGAAK